MAKLVKFYACDGPLCSVCIEQCSVCRCSECEASTDDAYRFHACDKHREVVSHLHEKTFEEPAKWDSAERDAMETSERSEKIRACARAAHECNRAYCAALGDFSQLPWEHAKTWQRDSAIKGVEGVLAGNGPRESHMSWLNEKAADGWKYGPVKDEAKKEHPCFVSYGELPEAQKQKDVIFVSVVRAMASALGLMP